MDNGSVMAEPRSSPAAEGLEIHVLGSGSALPDATRDTTALALRAPDGWTLVECPGAVVHKLARLGVRPHGLRRLLLSHDHVDHVYGLPHLLHAMACTGLKDLRLELHAPRDTLDTVSRMVAAHRLDGPGYPRLEATAVPMEEGATVVEGDGLRIVATPAEHGRDTVALRFEDGTAAACYSSDTRPSERLAALAREVALLFHDCAGPHRLRERFGHSHSSALEAAEIAAAAGVSELVLIHLGPDAQADPEGIQAEAQGAFAGRVHVARDGDVYRLGGSVAAGGGAAAEGAV